MQKDMFYCFCVTNATFAWGEAMLVGGVVPNYLFMLFLFM